MNVSTGLATVTPTVLEALRFATIDGAAALGLDRVTSTLEVGKSADIVTLRTDGLHFMPPAEDVAAVVLQCRPSDVGNVLVGGRFLKRDGVLPGWDLARLRQRIADTARHLADAAVNRRRVETATSLAYSRAISARADPG